LVDTSRRRRVDARDADAWTRASDVIMRAVSSRRSGVVAARVASRRDVRRRTARQGADFLADDRKSYGEWGVDGIRQNSSSMAAMSGSWESAAREVWLRHGVRSETRLARLLILGSRRDRTSGALGELFRDPAAIELMCETLERLLPGVSAGTVFHKCPEAGSTCVDAAATQRQLVRVRSALPVARVRLERVIEGAPILLVASEESASRADAATRALARALEVGLDDERLRETVESGPDLLFMTTEAIDIAVEEMRVLNDCLHHRTLADFVAAHAEALSQTHVRLSLAQTIQMRRDR